MKENIHNGSAVEFNALKKSGDELLYPPREKMGVLVAENFPALGRLAALRFVEWVQLHPDGVVSLPTGKTPEYFIKNVSRYLAGWKNREIAKELESYGINPSIYPSMNELRFVQMDEFYPIEPDHHNSFNYYVNHYYIKGFGLDPSKCMLMDCTAIGLPEGMSLEEIWPESGVDISLRFRHPADGREQLRKEVIERIDQWCQDYEDKIRAMGGIGFFMGGIGPDGHIAFNMAGSDHRSVTRLSQTNYETQAAASADLGGIEVARSRLVLTIGLSTITLNPGCTAIILAAGEAKAGLVRDGVEAETDIHFPVIALRSLPEARFYVTAGAAKLLEERRFRLLEKMEIIPDDIVEKVIVDLAVAKNTPVRSLTEKDLKSDRFGAVILSRAGKSAGELYRDVEAGLVRKIAAGSDARSGTAFLHTAPHHDDIILGYLPYTVRNIRDASNTHTFAYMTSGFNAVTNRYALSLVCKLDGVLHKGLFDALIREGYFSPGNMSGRRRDVWQYLDGVASRRQDIKDEGEARRMLRNLMEIFEDEDIDNLRHRIDELKNYLETQYPGKKDLPYIQKLKGMIREWESDCKWGYLGFDCRSIHHLRLGFYQGDLFTEEPLVDRDVKPILELLRKTKPGIVTAALDPEASGPDTHYKVLQAVAAALRLYQEETGRTDIEVLGYRNIWFRFHPSEANVYVPVSLNMFAVLQSTFENAFVSQREASFPSYEYEGTFSELARKIQVDQYRMLKTCLGREFFYEHQRPLIRATRGFVFLRMMTLEEFYSHARELRMSTEAI